VIARFSEYLATLFVTGTPVVLQLGLQCPDIMCKETTTAALGLTINTNESYILDICRKHKLMSHWMHFSKQARRLTKQQIKCKK